MHIISCAARQVYEKYHANGKVFCTLMDLEKANIRVDRKALSWVLSFYGVGGNYTWSMAETERVWFPVKVGLRRGCGMTPWQFILYKDGVVRVVNACVVGRDSVGRCKLTEWAIVCSNLRMIRHW